ncbi:MAG: hypothetical protein M2R45_03141 [Verrucomicrobia subdivision 3 bacterium]|nr:hypothetical protein [Limisphaerales bacterium]MCS1413209.1 hypothetical protein [Limisphaerales bacterium]
MHSAKAKTDPSPFPYCQHPHQSFNLVPTSRIPEVRPRTWYGRLIFPAGAGITRLFKANGIFITTGASTKENEKPKAGLYLDRQRQELPEGMHTWFTLCLGIHIPASNFGSPLKQSHLPSPLRTRSPQGRLPLPQTTGALILRPVLGADERGSMMAISAPSLGKPLLRKDLIHTPPILREDVSKQTPVRIPASLRNFESHSTSDQLPRSPSRFQVTGFISLRSVHAVEADSADFRVNSVAINATKDPHGPSLPGRTNASGRFRRLNGFKSRCLRRERERFGLPLRILGHTTPKSDDDEYAYGANHSEISDAVFH